MLVCSVKDLPLHYAISWFEQEATAVLLTMLHLGLGRIHLGPTLLQFLTLGNGGPDWTSHIRQTCKARVDLAEMLQTACYTAPARVRPAVLFARRMDA